MNDIKKIPLTAEKSASSPVRAVNRKTPKEIKRDKALDLFLTELRNNPLILTGCTDPKIYASKTPTPTLSVSPTATASVVPSASPSVDPYSDFYTGHYNYPAGDYFIAYFVPNPKNEKFYVEISAKAFESEMSSRVKDNKKAAELYYSINFNPGSWHQFSGYTGSVKKMSLSELTYSEISPEEFHNAHGANQYLVIGTTIASSWRADLIADDNAKLFLRFFRERSTFAYKIAASFASEEIKTPASASITILKKGDAKYNGDVVFLATDAIPDETTSDYFTGKDIPQRLYTGIKDSSGSIRVLYVYPIDSSELKK